VILRFSPHTKIKWIHRLQVVYAVFFYGITTLYCALLKDFLQFAKYKKDGLNKNTDKQNTVLLLKIIFEKPLYFFIFLILPIYILGSPFGEIIGGFLIMHFIAGVVLTVIFQLAHTVEGTAYPLADETGTVENNWAIHQMNTTVNFARYNRFISW